MAKSVKKPQDRLSKKPKVGTLVEVTIASGWTGMVPVILPETIPAGVIRRTRHIVDENDRTMAILWETLELFCNEEQLAELDTLTVEELDEAIELANGGASPKE